MLSMILYGISILFSPGPVVVMALNKGINNQFRKGIPFYLSIGISTYCLIVLYSLVGSTFVSPLFIKILTILGCLYLLFLSYKLFFHNHETQETTDSQIGFKGGFLMQLLNPKATIAALPIATIYYPLNQIRAGEIWLVSLLFLLLGVLSPLLYGLLGHYFTKWITSNSRLKTINRLMAGLLAVVSVMMFYEGVMVDFLGL